ncbi:hypothetical protein CW736_08380 [Nonlabens sp. MB-3u-79]|jgi:hypothetical protein|uniref:hypothetical protein n=1 Tax=Nonlabens sp. MB-3u-79 TaxID=2058134 RepID=UPI000C304C3F|nr:hypothetical protein [Nonlabens sp. MB-3u-79]AUC79393.1 hypothetical protein CW736_08380 [Nonlabens sp. MB-3u-79]|tara:strand:+ start:98 stop:475 length:378 start_codon:yes stop_codon:yes gene_type:complete
MLPITYYDLSYAELFVFPKYMIAQMKSGIILAPENNDELNAIAQNHFAGKNFVYISNRIFDYNVSPVIYLEASKIPNLIGMSIVTDKEKRTALFESKFYAKEFLVASTIEEAVNWAVDLIEKNKP